MDLSSNFNYQGWDIKYSILKSGAGKAPEQLKRVVFVHGTPWSSVVYKPIVEALLAKGSYEVLDLPGYGNSQKYNSSDAATTSDGNFIGDTSVKFQALALTELLKHVKFDDKEGYPAPAVVAHDIAGTIVLRAHLFHDCCFESMLLFDTNAILPWGDGFYKLARAEYSTFLRLPPNVFEAVVYAVIRSACFDPKVLETGWDKALAKPWTDDFQSGQPSFVRQIAQANDADVAEMLDSDAYQRVKCHVKVVWGEKDEWIPKHKMEELIRLLGDRVKAYTSIPDAGHLLMLDQPVRFALEVFDWLKNSE